MWGNQAASPSQVSSRQHSHNLPSNMTLSTDNANFSQAHCCQCSGRQSAQLGLEHAVNARLAVQSMVHHSCCVVGCLCLCRAFMLALCLLMTSSAVKCSPVWRANRVINAHLAVCRAQPGHVVDEEGLDDGVAEQLCGGCDARRVLLRDQLALRSQSERLARSDAVCSCTAYLHKSSAGYELALPCTVISSIKCISMPLFGKRKDGNASCNEVSFLACILPPESSCEQCE